MRTSQALAAIIPSIRAAGLEAEAALIEEEARRVRGIEMALEAVLGAVEEEPIIFRARRPGRHSIALAEAAD